jgi:hypothetical protein
VPYRENQGRVTVSVDGVSLGVSEDRTGGGQDSTETTYQMGGMGPRISLGGNPQVDNVVVRMLYDSSRMAQIKWLLGRVGKGTMVIVDQPLDDNGAAFGEPLVWTCRLKRVTPPERTADSTAGARLELEGTVNGTIT